MVVCAIVALACSEGQDCCTTVGIVSGVQDWVLAVWCARPVLAAR